MDCYSQNIIRELGKKEFNTADVVSTINQRKEWQEEYIKLSNEYGSYNKLNAQIGRYLGNKQNQERLGIEKNGKKEISTAITGRLSPNQKWKVLLVSLLLLFMGFSSYAQTLTPKENSKAKWGYVNEKEKVVIKYKYDEAREFSEELAAVKIYDKKSASYKWGFIDRTGKEIIPLTYESVGDFSEGMAKVREGYYWGFIDKTEKEIIPIKYNEIGNFSEEGVAKVKKGLSWGFIDKTGKEIIPIKYDVIENFSEEGVAKVRKGNSWGFIDKTGKEIIPVKYNEIGEFSELGVAKVREGDYWGFIDKTVKVILPIEYNEIGAFNDGLAKVKKNKKFGFIDKTGKVIIPLKYDEIGNFSVEGLAKVREGDYWGFIDKTGKEIVPVKYNEIGNFSNGYAAVEERRNSWSNQWGIIDKAGNEVLPKNYLKEEALNMLSDRALLQKEIQHRENAVMLIEEVEMVLDNDYYSVNSHSQETLKALYDNLMQLKSVKYLDSDEKKYITEIKKYLFTAMRTKLMTQKYGAATAKKIMAGQYEIGMSKSACLDASAVLQETSLFSEEYVYNIYADVFSKTATTEVLKIGIPVVTLSGRNDKIFYLHFRNDKLERISY